jgi:ADP-ribose pyrophosphatase YjhB (NUDIX family)
MSNGGQSGLTILERPATTAAAFILDEDGRVLLIRENYGRRRYGPPGGLVEPGESPQQACIREVREETTMDVAVQHLIGTYSFPNLPEPFISNAFRCKIIGGAPAIPLTGEIAYVGWFDASELPEPLTHLAPNAIADLIAGRQYVERVIHESYSPRE